MNGYTYYYDGIPATLVHKTEKALTERLASGSAELTLKNGLELLVARRPNGAIQIYDDEPNLIAEFDDEHPHCGHIPGNGLFNAAMFIIKASRRNIY